MGRSVVVAALLLLSLPGCGDDPVAYSTPVAVNIKPKADVEHTTVDEGKAVTTENGNPYGAFVTQARARLGRDPMQITIEQMTLTLGAGSTGVTSLEEVFAGDAQVLLVMNDTNNSYPVGVFPAPTGTGPLGGHVAFVEVAPDSPDYGKLLTGSFQVFIRGPAAATFLQDGPKADLQVALTFAAYP